MRLCDTQFSWIIVLCTLKLSAFIFIRHLFIANMYDNSVKYTLKYNESQCVHLHCIVKNSSNIHIQNIFHCHTGLEQHGIFFHIWMVLSAHSHYSDISPLLILLLPQRVVKGSKICAFFSTYVHILILCKGQWRVKVCVADLG